MSTRAVYTFQSGAQYEPTPHQHLVIPEYHIYGHFDGYLTGAAQKLANMLPYSWRGVTILKGGRFSHTDMAAAFIAGNKEPGGGDIELTSHWSAHIDLAYRYEIYPGVGSGQDSKPMIKAYQRADGITRKVRYWMVFDGSLAAFLEEYRAELPKD